MRAFMQMRLAALDKSMGNALGYVQQPHILLSHCVQDLGTSYLARLLPLPPLP